jgi:hypothetical protein
MKMKLQDSFFTSDCKEGFDLLKRLTTIHPDKRDGGLVRALLINGIICADQDIVQNSLIDYLKSIMGHNIRFFNGKVKLDPIDANSLSQLLKRINPTKAEV